MTGPDFTKHPQGQQPQGPPSQGYGYPPPPPSGYPPPPGYGWPPPGGYSYPPMVDKPLGWFIVNWLFFWPTAIYSLVKHWNNIDRDLYYGNVPSAQAHASAVRRLGIIAIIINVALVVFWIVIAVTLFATASHCINGTSSVC